MPPLNGVDLAWMAMAAAGLTLGLIHLFVWARQRARLDFLVFFVLATAAAAFGAFELQMMRAATPAAWATAVRASHVPLALFVVATAVFVRLHFGTGRLGLLAAIVVLRVATLVLNFTTGVNVNFAQVVGLGHVGFWGDTLVSVPIGTPGRWTRVPQLSNLLLLVFVADAARTLWRRGDARARQRAWLVGGSVVACVAATGMMAALTVYGVLHLPTILLPAFLVVLLAMSLELSGDVLRAAGLAQALAASEQRLRAVVEATPSAILLVDAAGRILLANPQAERSFGLAREQLVGRAIDTLIPERLRAGHAQLRAAYAAKPELRLMGAGRELAALRADGSEFPVEVSLAPLGSGRQDQVLVALADISQRRRSELEAAQQRAELAHLSRVAMLGELSGALAHEINQPLAAILSNAQAALRFLTRDPPSLQPVGEALQAIVTNDRRASQVIERLRALLRKGEALREAVDLNELVDESLRLLRSDLAQRGIEAGVELQPAMPAVMGDRVQLQQVLLNLIVNAGDAMQALPPPRPLRIRTWAGDGSVRIEVGDRGPGIAPADAERVFDAFYSTKAQGLGLGLALCRTIVQAHDGRIGAGQNEGGGARLWVELPARGENMP
ncbi:MAG TPA: PAS domain S-box protein [Rubrivivax sp.]|nr:PAS domain S-box protein [Rubrivivax sp.]HPO19463.1 PAS domain S-box protein [Rubrivivax sp.]